jgi:hypothetical protein
MGWGTAFAVSREGILLTNAHVFGDDKFGPPLNSSDPLVASFLKKAAEDLEARLKSEIVETLGRESPPWRRARFNAEDVDSVEHQTVITKLTDWLAKRAGINAKFSSARIVLDSGFGPSALSDKPHGQVFADVEVLKIGQPWPGKDVAVLRLYDRVLANANRDRTGEKAAEEAKYMGLSDKLICLPLGNSDDVYPGTQIHSFGFPGLGIFPEFTESAKDVVDVRIGELGNKKETFGGWEAFQLTANITHGDSGGPVVDRNGNAVAINVAGGEITAGQGMAIPTGFNVAIPINLAKGFLEQAGVKPEPGPLLQLWQEALTFYSQGKYDRALERFKALDNKIDETPDPTSTPSLLQKFHNRYVALMELRTRDRIKEQH